MRSRGSGTAPFSLFAFQDIITSVTGIMILITMLLALELVHNKANSPEVKTTEIADTVDQAVLQNEREIERLEQIIDQGADVIRFDSETLRKRIEELRKASSELQLQNASLENELASAETRQSQLDEQAQLISPETLVELQQELETARRELQKLKSSNRVIFNRPQGESKTPWLLEIEAGSIKVAEVEKSAKPLKFATPEDFSGWASRQDSGSIYFVLLLKPSGVRIFGDLRETLQNDEFDIGYDLLAADQQAIDPETGAGVN
ncbi:MAG: hypothetical protein ABGZ35_25265 [Planctomycetaceae bacterium]